MKDIIIQGAGFADNFGDVLFYDIFIKEAMSQGINIDFFSTNEKVTKHLPLNEKNNSKSKLSKLMRSEGIVFIGGGYMGEQPYKSKVLRYRWGLSTIKNILGVGLLGVLFNKRIIVIGVGSGPVSNPLTRWVIRRICNKADHVLARDQESYEALKKMKVKNDSFIVTTDTVLALGKYYTPTSFDFGAEKIVTLHLSESPDVCEKSKTVVEDLTRFLKENPDYGLVAITDHNTDGQVRAIHYLENVFEEDVLIHKYESPTQLINVLYSSDLIITNKLHVGIVAAVLGKSVVSLPNHPKVKGFFKQIGEAGRCIDFKKIGLGDVYPLLDKYKNKPIEINGKLIEKADMNIDYFRKFVRE